MTLFIEYNPPMPTKNDGRTRLVLSVSVPAALKAAVERERRARNLPTVSGCVEQVLTEALDAAAKRDRDEVTLAQLRRLNLRLDRAERDARDARARDTLTVELLTTLLRVYLAHTPPPEDGDKAALKRSAEERFGRLLEALEARLAEGRSMLDRVSEDVAELVDDPRPAPA